MSTTEEDTMHTHTPTKSLSKIISNSIASCSLKTQIYTKINPKLFDVSLRDGIQNADPAKYPTQVKKQIFQNIFKRYNPANIEIGSIVSSKVLPIMADTVNLHEYITNELDGKYSNMSPYVLVPNNKCLNTAIMNGIRNFSFITSVSNAFQLKNTRTTIVQTKEELKRMEDTLNCYRRTHNRKLYISCINECPIGGKIDNDYIVHEILHYHTHYQFTEICLSDTMGTLTYDDFEYIVDTIRYFGLPVYKISLHLHMSNSNTDEIRKILYYCFDKNINKFDVSLLTDGGCSVTMGKSALPNLTYDRFYEILEKYLIREMS
jgi:hypothetical protein